MNPPPFIERHGSTITLNPQSINLTYGDGLITWHPYHSEVWLNRDWFVDDEPGAYVLIVEALQPDLSVCLRLRGFWTHNPRHRFDKIVKA